jgi:membrane protein YqaA with SNARE-associated domain
MNFPKKHRTILKIVILVLFFVVAIWFANQIKDNEAVKQLVQRFGYFGVLIIAFISGFNVVIPIPAISFLPIFTEAGMSTLGVVAIVSIGMTMGDGLGYLLGRYGREVVHPSTWPMWLQRAEAFLNRYKYGLPVFLFLYASLAPFPNELVVIPAAATKHAWWSILVPIFAGNLILNILIAFGITSLFL